MSPQKKLFEADDFDKKKKLFTASDFDKVSEYNNPADNPMDGKDGTSDLKDGVSDVSVFGFDSVLV